ncbi:GntP family permease [Amycolatopsis thermoflava]|uniref:H+/gluconate symporter-like permease n=1 Tax=Amycolatopsis thermoflava TaxID=84480 RepID=A0A3N2G6G8_9PSEU|nr:SLC13 family permease [Amycolatopsis thermoflava]ROS32224.1 H+/gluconate symporter-like permease [Amycolatopsis thermoflava]
MSDTAILINTGVTVAAIVVLIVRFRLNPVIALVLGSCYLGLSTGLGVSKTVEEITAGFGDVMAEIGLLIAFGVLIGAILRDLRAIERLVDKLLKVFGERRIPYAMALTIATVLQSIFLDVLLVISGPLARGIGKRLGPRGVARMATALAIALECGIVFTVPGVGALALAGLLHVPLGKYLLFGLVVVIPTVTVAIAIMSVFFARGWWNPAKDEMADEIVTPEARPQGGPGTVAAVDLRKPPALPVVFSPLLGALVLIATGAVAEMLEWSNPVVAFLSSPVVALLLGLVGTCLIGRRYMGQPAVESALGSGLRDSGQILLLNGVGGCLAAVLAAAGLGDILGKYFSANTWAPLLLVWLMAAVLHIAVGSVTISAITSAGLLAPIAPSLGLDPVLIALSAGAGSLFMVHLTSNTFWLLQSLLGQTTRGALKTVSVGVSVASVVALGPILALNLVL